MKCFQGCGRDALEGKATCGDVFCGSTSSRDPRPVPGLPSTLAECKSGHILELGESDRQLVLMALAHLSLRYPGFDYALNLVARKIDNESIENPGRAAMFDGFRKSRADEWARQQATPAPARDLIEALATAANVPRSNVEEAITRGDLVIEGKIEALRAERECPHCGSFFTLAYVTPSKESGRLCSQCKRAFP